MGTKVLEVSFFKTNGRSGISKKKSEIKEDFQTSVRFDFPHLVSTLSQLFYQTEFC